MLVKVLLTLDDSKCRLGDLSGIPGVVETLLVPDGEPQLLPAEKRTPKLNVHRPVDRGFNVKAVLDAVKSGPKHYSMVEKVMRQPAGFSSLISRQSERGYLNFDRSTRMITLTDAGLARLTAMEAANGQG